MRKSSLTSMCAVILLISAEACPTACSCRSRGLVDCSKHNHFSIPAGLPNTTIRLHLQSSAIHQIDMQSLQNCTGLKLLDITNNLVSELPPELFTTLKQLEEIVLRRNIFSKFPQSMLSVESLVKIDLRSNRIKSLSPADWASISSVKIVDLSRNNLTFLPILPNDFAALSSIEELDLSSNGITGRRNPTEYAVSQSIATAEKSNIVNHKDLSRNPLTLLDALTFAGTSSLTMLNISRCNISVMEDGSFYGATRLRELDLSYNKVATIDEGWLFGLSSLVRLDLSSNLITSISSQAWNQIPSLKSLNLANNRLRAIPSSAFRSLRNLESLSLASNSIDSYHEAALTGLDELTSLDVSSNRLAAIIEDSSIVHGTLPKLTELNFANNSLIQIPAHAFERFPSLTTLDIRDNNITSIAEHAFEPLKLRQLSSFTSTSHNPPIIMTALEGETVHVECTAMGAAPLTIEWIETSKRRSMDESHVVNTVYAHSKDEENEEFSSSLELNDLNVGERAEYQCVARNRFGVDYSSRTIVESVDAVYIAAVKLEDAGVYTCTAANAAGSTHSSATLRVYDNAFLLPLFSRLSVDMGATTVLDCTCEAQSGQRIEWTKNGKRFFYDSEAIREDKIGKRSLSVDAQTLTISEVDATDGGSYECALMAGTHLLARRTMEVVVNVTSLQQEVEEALRLTSISSRSIEYAHYFVIAAIPIVLITAIVVCTWCACRRRRRRLRKIAIREEALTL